MPESFPPPRAADDVAQRVRAHIGSTFSSVVHPRQWTGELFFASDQEFIDAFEYAADPPHVIIDMSRAHVWDASAVAALDAIEHHYDRHDVEVTITGLNSHSHVLHNTLSGQTAAAHS